MPIFLRDETTPQEDELLDTTSNADAETYEFFLAILESSFFTAALPVIGVILGALFTHKLTHSNKIKEDNRERLLGAVMEALQASHELLINFRDYAYNAPRGGGMIRAADDPNAAWERIDEEAAHEHDVAAAEAVNRMLNNSNRLEELTVRLEVFAPRDLTESFQALPNRVTRLFSTLMEVGTHRGQLAEDALQDMEQLYEKAVAQTRRLAKVPRKRHASRR